MELGAKVCTVHQPPDCETCPIRQQCQARAEVEDYLAAGGDPASAPSVMAYPGKVEKAKRAEQSVAACVLEVQSADAAAEPQLLLVQRPEKGLLAGERFWCLNVPAQIRPVIVTPVMATVMGLWLFYADQCYARAKAELTTVSGGCHARFVLSK